MEDGRILDSQITASTSYNPDHRAQLARLNLVHQPPDVGGWNKANQDTNSWLQIDFLSPTIVSRVITQCRGDGRYCTTKFQISMSNDGIHFEFYDEFGKVMVSAFILKTSFISARWHFTKLRS